MTLDMPPLRFAQTNGIRMGYYDCGPPQDRPPLVLCHGWPELAFSWRYQLKALAAAGLRAIAPDQRGYGATDRPPRVEDYDLEQLCADLVGLLDHLGIEQAVFVGHDWGGFVVWQMALRHPQRVAGVVGVNTPHLPRAPIDPIEILRRRFGERMYIVRFQEPSREADAVLDSHVEQTFDCFMRKPPRRLAAAGDAPPNLAFIDMIAGYDAARDQREPILSPQEKQVFVDAFTRSGFSGGLNWYRNITRNWQRSAALDPVVRVPALMLMAEHDAVLPPSAADGMEKLVPDLEKVLIHDSGHWTQQEQPAEVSARLIEWRRRRFG